VSPHRPARLVVDDVTQDYRATLRRFLPRRDEAARESAYELGRQAFTGGISLLVMARIHQNVAIEVLHETAPDDLLDVAERSGELLLEVLAAYDMSHRSVLEPRHDDRTP